MAASRCLTLWRMFARTVSFCVQSMVTERLMAFIWLGIRQPAGSTRPRSVHAEPTVEGPRLDVFMGVAGVL